MLYDRESGETYKTKLTLEQSDPGIHCLHLNLLEESIYGLFW